MRREISYTVCLFTFVALAGCPSWRALGDDAGTGRGLIFWRVVKMEKEVSRIEQLRSTAKAELIPVQNVYK